MPFPVPSMPGARHVLTIGTFDGVHLGHRALVRRAVEAARSVGGARVAALVFDPNPIEVLRPEHAPPRLTSFERRRGLLLSAGADEVLRLEPSRELLDFGAEQFVLRCVELFKPTAFVEGADFRFGHGRAGDLSLLRRMGSSLGFGVHTVESVEVALGDHQIVPARSSVARWLLAHGRVSDAAIVLGRWHELEGTVVTGDRRGRTIGFPTANLHTDVMLPADGVYAARATLPGGRTLAAALSIGRKPTFGVHERAVEAHLLRDDAAGNAWTPLEGLSEYGWTLRLELLAWVREQVRFASLPALLDQLGRDCQRVREIARGSGSQVRSIALETPA